MTDSDNSNLFPVSSAPKMNKSKNKNKIPRGATGIMPGKSSNNSKNKPKTIIGFKGSKANIDEKDNNNPPDDEDYEVEVTKPSKAELVKEAQNEDKMHPNAKLSKEEQDDTEYLKPELDEQRRRESVVLDEDGEEFKEIQRQREERQKIEELRKESDNLDLDEMEDLSILPNLSGMTRLVTDPMKNNDQTIENKEDDNNIDGMEDVATMLPNLSGMTRLVTDPMMLENNANNAILENKENDSNEIAMMPNLSGMTRLVTDPMKDKEIIENTQNKDETIKHIPVRVTNKDNVDNNDEYEDEEFNMDALNMLPNLSGMTRLQTDPMMQQTDNNDNDLDNDDLSALGNLSGLSRLTTDPVSNLQNTND